jgi:hypothetical protein
VTKTRDIETLISYAGSLTTLKKQGNRHYGICPIPSHNEKTGSFIIDENTGRWKCYGCGASGSDAIWLYIEVNNLDPKNGGYQIAKKALGLWNNKLPEPRAKAPQLPRAFESNDRRECYKMARQTLIKMWDCEITYKGKTTWNHEFILQALATHPERDQYIERICTGIAKQNKLVNPWTFITLFINEAYKQQ